MITASQPEVKYFLFCFLFFGLSMLLKEACSLVVQVCVSACCHGECAHYIIVSAREKGERGTRGQGVAVLRSHRAVWATRAKSNS